MSTPVRAARRRAPSPPSSTKPATTKAASTKPATTRSATKAAAPSPRPSARAAARPDRPSPRPQPRPDAARQARGADAATATATARAPKRAPRPAAPPLEVVAPVRRRLRLRMLGGVMCALLFVAMLGIAVFHSMLVQGQLGLDRTDDQIEQEQMRQRELREQVAALAAPDRIQAEAIARGMVQPENRAYLPAVVPGAVVPPPEAAE